jgi:uridine kinase
MTPEERKAINFDHPDAFDWKLLAEHIQMLKEGKAVEQPTYSYIESNRQRRPYTSIPSPSSSSRASWPCTTRSCAT